MVGHFCGFYVHEVETKSLVSSLADIVLLKEERRGEERREDYIYMEKWSLVCGGIKPKRMGGELVYTSSLWKWVCFSLVVVW